MASSECDARVTRVLRQWFGKAPANDPCPPQQRPLARWNGSLLHVLVSGRVILGDLSQCRHGVCTHWLDAGFLSAGTHVVQPLRHGIIKLSPDAADGSTPWEEDLFIAPPLLPDIAPPPSLVAKQPARSVVVLVIDSASRPVVREMAPKFSAALRSAPGSVLFPQFHSVAQDLAQSEWALLFGRVPPPDFWVEDECHDMGTSEASAELLAEARKGEFLPSVFRRAGFRTALASTLSRPVARCLGSGAWDAEPPNFFSLFTNMNDHTPGDAITDGECLYGKTVGEQTLDWSLEVLRQGSSFLFVHMKASRRLRVDLHRQDDALAAFVKGAVALGAVVVAVAPQGQSSPPCDTRLAFLGVANLPGQPAPEYDALFSVVDLHSWLVGMAAGHFALPSAKDRTCATAGIPADHCVDSAGSVMPAMSWERKLAEGSAGLCGSPEPVLEARPMVNVALPRVHSSPHIGRLDRTSNKWGVPMGDSEVLVNGRNISFDDVLHGYDIIWYERRLFLAGSYQGVALQQDPADALVLADLLWRHRPDLVIELGTFMGGSTIFFADQMTRYDPHALVLTIDPKPVNVDVLLEDSGQRLCPHCRSAECHPLWHSGAIKALRGRSVDPRVLAQVRMYAASAQRVVVIHDALHTYEAVLADLEAYAPFVTKGSYLVVQDTALDRINDKPMALAAARDFLRSPAGASFRIDKTFEYYLYSNNNDGFLRRVS